MALYYLGNLIEETRRRGGLPKPLNRSGGSYDSTSDTQIATYLNEALQQTSSKIIHTTAGYVSTRNAGWSFKQLPLDIDSAGYATMPADVGKLVGVRQSANARGHMRREGVGSSYSGDYRIEPMRIYAPRFAGQTVYIDYNSNSAYMLIQGTVQSSTSTTFVLSDSAMLHGGELVNTDNYYNGLDIKVVSGTGSGQVARVSSYVASTGTFTVGSAFSTGLDTTSVVATILPLPVEAIEYFLYETLLRLPMAAESDRYMAAHERSYRAMMSSIFAKESYQ